MRASFKKRRAGLWSLAVGLVMIVSLGVFSRAVFSHQEEEKPSSGGSRSSSKDAQILKKLDQVLANQAVLLQKFDAVMEELRVIKIRASLNR